MTPPSARRLRQARRRGEVPVARDLTAAAALAGGLAGLAAGGDGLVAALAEALRRAVALAAVAPDPWTACQGALALLARAALPPCGAAALAAAAAGALQTGGLVAPAALRPRLARLSPAAGLARLAGRERLLGVALRALEAGALLALGAWLAAGAARAAAGAPGLGAAALLRALARLAAGIAWPLAGALAAAGAVELALARRQHLRRLGTTRAQALRERREEEGDPRWRAERRRLHRALAEAPPLRRATCLIVNPTRLAVALHHARGSDDAPVVVAKALGAAAGPLRAAARRAGVPIVRDPPLARALYRLAEVGEAIPPELYDAAAAVLVHLHARAAAAPGASP